MKKRESLITEDTIIDIDIEVFKERAKKLKLELFFDFVNSHFPSPVIEINYDKSEK